MIYACEKTGVIPGLNFMRFLAAAMVIAAHAGLGGFLKQEGYVTLSLFIQSNKGVTIFYVLSGFLITSLAIDEIREKGYFCGKSFFVRRALRLMPLFYLALLVIFILDVIGVTYVKNESYLYAFFYLFNMVPRDAYHPMLGAFHTLATEEQFYLFFGIMLSVFFGTINGRNIGAKLIVIVFISLIAIFFNRDLAMPLMEYNGEYFINRWLIWVIDPLCYGVVAAILFKSKWLNCLLSKLYGKNELNIAINVMSLFMAIYFYGLGSIEKNIVYIYWSVLLVIFSLYFFRESFFSNILENKLFVYLGTISYGLYVWQSIILQNGPNKRFIDSTWLAIALVVFISVISYELYEKTFLSMKRKWKESS